MPSQNRRKKTAQRAGRKETSGELHTKTTCKCVPRFYESACIAVMAPRRYVFAIRIYWISPIYTAAAIPTRPATKALRSYRKADVLTNDIAPEAGEAIWRKPTSWLQSAGFSISAY
jgi:hypothetical protein